MPIVLRTAEESIAEMIATTRGATSDLTDLNVGSVVRTIYEAVAIEQERVEQYVLLAIGESGINRTAMSMFEDRTPLSAQASYGEVTISCSAAPTTNYTFPAGTLVRTSDGLHSYTINSSTVFKAGTTALAGVQVTAVVAGAASNIPAGTISAFVSTQPVPGQSVSFVVTNPRALITGSDAESDSDRISRFQAYLRGLHRADAESVRLGAKTTLLQDVSGYITERVAYAQVIDIARGFAYCYVASASSTPPLQVPVSPTLASNTTGGSLPAGTYTYRVSAITANGETLASQEPIAPIVTTGSTSVITVTWPAISGATGYRVYGRTAGSELLISQTATGSVVAFVDTGTIGPAGPLPTANTTGVYATPSAALIAQCQHILNGYVDPITNLRVPGYKAAGVTCTVIPATLVPVSMSYSIVPQASTTVAAITPQIYNTINAYFAALDIGDPVRIEYLDDAILNIPGVLDIGRGFPTTNALGYPYVVGTRYVPGGLALSR